LHQEPATTSRVPDLPWFPCVCSPVRGARSAAFVTRMVLDIEFHDPIAVEALVTHVEFDYTLFHRR